MGSATKGSEYNSLKGKETYLLHNIQTASGSQFPKQGAFSQWTKWPGEADHSSPSTVEHGAAG
jgi:hypothetical protein